MKHKLLTLFYFVSICFVNAQDLKHTVSIGAGFPNLPRLLFNTYNSERDAKSTGTGPYHLKYEYRVSPFIGLGLSINHITYTITYNKDFLDTFSGKLVVNKIKISNNNTAFNFRTNFHFINPEENEHWDVYAGIGIGFRTGKLIIDADYKEGAPSIELPPLNRLGLETTIGFRYMIDENLGFYFEAGAAKSIVQLGFSGRF